MKPGNLYDICKYVLLGLLCILITVFLFSSLRAIPMERAMERFFARMSDYNYVPDIKELKAEGKLSEALEMARFVIRHPDMPGQEQAKQLEEELERELTSLWGRAKRATKGFVVGGGNSIEELGGGIASDMLVYGDIRDLVKQGYYRVTGKETDPVIVALAGLGLLTEFVDAADWAPAVLKAFRKAGALSKKFAAFITTACKKSTKMRKLDGALKQAFKGIRILTDKMGLGRAAAVFKHVDTPADLAAISKVAQMNPDAAYFTLKHGGRQGVYIVKTLGGSEAGVAAMAKAARKGPRAIEWLARGGAGHKYVLRTRFGARFIKTLRLDRPQQLVTETARNSPGLRGVLWVATGLTLLGSVLAFVEAGRRILRARRKLEIP